MEPTFAALLCALGLILPAPPGFGGDIVIEGTKRIRHDLFIEVSPDFGSLGTAYTIRDGDSLAKIAETQLGDQARWPEIQLWNKIESPDLLKPGVTLVLPPRILPRVEPGQTDWVLLAAADFQMGGLPVPVAKDHALPPARYHITLFAVPRSRVGELFALTRERGATQKVLELGWLAKSPFLPGIETVKDTDPATRLSTTYEWKGVENRAVQFEAGKTRRFGRDDRELSMTPGLSGGWPAKVLLSSLALAGVAGLACLARRRSGITPE